MQTAQDPGDWWMWQMYRQVAEFIHNPSPTNAARLQSLLAGYQRYRDQQATGTSA